MSARLRLLGATLLVLGLIAACSVVLVGAFQGWLS